MRKSIKNEALQFTTSVFRYQNRVCGEWGANKKMSFAIMQQLASVADDWSFNKCTTPLSVIGMRVISSIT